MQDGYNQNEMPLNNTNTPSNGPTIVKTDVGSKDGQNKCPKCGSTEIMTNVNTGKLRCLYCRTEFEPEKVAGLDGDVNELVGEVIGSGATDIVADTNEVLTFKCSSCGAEVVVDTSEKTSAKCHWCRSVLSVNQQVPNGSVPDVVLPFTVSKEDARSEIEKFVNKRKFYANPNFKKEFTTENIMGVYFPYMIVDVNAHSHFIGQGEHQTKVYTKGSGDSKKTYYEADLYNVEREFDIAIDDLSVESSKDKLNNASDNKTNNVINSIMPFDTENCVKWDANYLRGFTSEKRDVNVNNLRELVTIQSKDIARFAANDTLKHYDRGVAWYKENFDIKGQQWKAAYLPVWLYSYQEVKGDKKVLHYVAVNARTKETMGSVPVHQPKLILISAIIEVIAFLLFFLSDTDGENTWLILIAGFIYYFVMYAKYRNAGARHHHEKETKTKMSNLRSVDNYVEARKKLTESSMEGANNTRVSGQTNKVNTAFVAQLADQINESMNNNDE